MPDPTIRGRVIFMWTSWRRWRPFIRKFSRGDWYIQGAGIAVIIFPSRPILPGCPLLIQVSVEDIPPEHREPEVHGYG
jgi:hypothetical protein